MEEELLGIDAQGVFYKQDGTELTYDEFIEGIEAQGWLFGGFTKTVDLNKEEKK